MVYKLGLYSWCLLVVVIIGQGTETVWSQQKARVIVSTDIGGTDPDDFQSMIHYLMYADRFETEGLISSPYGPGRMSDILDIIALYEEDFAKLREKGDFPTPNSLRKIAKQGEVERAALKGFRTAT